MRKLCLLLSLSAATVVAQRPDPESARCNPGADRADVRSSTTSQSRPLGEMPDARRILAVYRQVDGCNVMLVREGPLIIEEPVGRPEQRRIFRP